MKELIAYAKSKPGALNYGSSGVGGAGHLGVELLASMYGLFGPAGTPPAIVVLLHRDVSQSLTSADAQAAFAKDGAEAAPSASPEAFRRVLAKEVEDWRKIVRLPGFAEALR